MLKAFRSALVLGIGVMVVACGAPETPSSNGESAIQGGTSWGGDYAVGMIGISPTGVCTGTLIAPDLVLTAGHCVQGFENTMTGFYLGAGAPIRATSDDPGPTQIPSNMIRYAIDKVAIYPGFVVSELLAGHVSTTAPDLGLIHLAEPVSNIPPRRIVDPATESTQAASKLTPGAECWAVGYGRHDVAGTTTVKEKRFAAVAIETVTTYSIETSAFPGAVSGGTADEGDSGGPLLCILNGVDGITGDNERIVGTVSYSTDGVGERHLRETYVRLEPYAAWIVDAMKHFPEEERCTITGGAMQSRCVGQDIQYCDGTRWRLVTTCSVAQTCVATEMRCR